MSAIAPRIRITPEDPGNLPDSKSYELVDGELVEIHPSIRSSRVAGVIFRLVDIEGARTNKAHVFPNDLAQPALAEFRCTAAAFFQ